MANQFSAKVRFDAFAWFARDRETRTLLIVSEPLDDAPARWSIYRDGLMYMRGTSTTARAARAKIRREVEKLRKR